MAWINLKTTLIEAEHLADGVKTFVFRNKNIHVGVGDVVTFTAYKNKQPTRHRIENMKFDVVYISTETPIDKDFKVIGVRKK